MKQVKGFWLPDSEEHLVSFLENGPEFAGGPTYQLHKFQAAFPYIKNFRHAVDVGAHCGLWSRVMVQCFGIVEAFEPVADHRACFMKNIVGTPGVWLHDCALGDHDADVTMITGPSSSGDTWLHEGGAGGGGGIYCEAKMRTLDSFNFGNVDFLKIDCEGYEPFVIRGGEQTIRRDKPCIVVEQKPGHGAKFGIGDKDALPILVGWGYKIRTEISGDFILTAK